MLTSPFFTRPTRTATIMLTVLLALIPGIAACVAVFGIGVLVQLALATVTALAAEAAVLALRRRPVRATLADGSAVLTAWLLALSLPPLAPWWLAVVGTAFAIVFAKQLYGGLGDNPFNPAMVGFAVLIVSFPALMNQWPAPLALPQPDLGPAAQLGRIFSGLSGPAWDAVASATPLDTLSTQVHRHVPVEAVLRQPIFGAVGGTGSEWIVLGYLAGGLFLLARRVVPWQMPAAYLGGLALTALIFGFAGSGGGPLFHLATGGAMLGAFFIVTDPVTGPSTPRGRLIFCLGAGFLTYVIRRFGAYPDGVAFAVLTMNLAVPAIDRMTQPPVFGRKGRRHE